MEIGFSLGSNVGDRLHYLSAARRQILAQEEAREVAASPVYETDPVDVPPIWQNYKFLNAILIVESPWPPNKWLAVAHKVETALGRARTADRNAPRTIDIDIIYAGDRVFVQPGLEVPHPRWLEREFVLRPLADVRPGLVLPGMNRPVGEIWRERAATASSKVSQTDW